MPHELDTLGIFHLVRIGSRTTAIIHAAENGGGRDDNDTLSVCAGVVSGAVYPELAV